MAYGLNTLGPKPSQQGTKQMAQTWGKVAPRLAGATPADGFGHSGGNVYGKQAPEEATSPGEQTGGDSVNPGRMGQ
jgi:hypothetical protein